jgi:hypothetical protein
MWRRWWARLRGGDPADEEPARADELERTYWRTADEVGDVLPQENQSKSERRRR